MGILKLWRLFSLFCSLLGNAGAICVLHHREVKLKKDFVEVLSALAGFDILFLLATFFLFTLPTWSEVSDWSQQWHVFSVFIHRLDSGGRGMALMYCTHCTWEICQRFIKQPDSKVIDSLVSPRPAQDQLFSEQGGGKHHLYLTTNRFNFLSSYDDLQNCRYGNSVCCHIMWSSYIHSQKSLCRLGTRSVACMEG